MRHQPRQDLLVALARRDFEYSVRSSQGFIRIELIEEGVHGFPGYTESSPSTQFHSGSGVLAKARRVTQTLPPLCQVSRVIAANIERMRPRPRHRLHRDQIGK